MRAYEIKRIMNEAGSNFFHRKGMSPNYDRMADYGVRKISGEHYLYRKLRPNVFYDLDETILKEKMVWEFRSKIPDLYPIQLSNNIQLYERIYKNS